MRIQRPAVRGLFLGRVSPDGRLHFTSDVRHDFDEWLNGLIGKAVDVEVHEHQDTRSIQANNYYWACVLTPVEEGNVGYTADEFHELMLEKFATRKQYALVNRTTGEAEEYVIPRRSSTMPISDFYKFVEQVRQFIAEFYGIATDDPDPDYWRKRQTEAA